MRCQRCLLEFPVLPYRVQSAIIDLRVCSVCMIEAVHMQHWPGPGNLVVSLSGDDANDIP